jgi:hypothetical protein
VRGSTVLSNACERCGSVKDISFFYLLPHMRHMPHMRHIFRPNGNVATLVIKVNGPHSRVEHGRKHKGTYGFHGLSLVG